MACSQAISPRGHTGTDGNSNEIHGQRQRNGEESDGSAHLRATGELIPKNQTSQNNDQHCPLDESVLSIDLKKHTCNDLMIKD